MAEFRFAPEDMDRARELLIRSYAPMPPDADFELAAEAIGAERRSHIAGAITDAGLRDVHDRLHASSAVRHRTPGVLEALAQALLERGVVPAPSDFGGAWWLWWPQQGRGPCQHCGQRRALRRYSARFDAPYRYLCRGCRQQEANDATEELNQATGVIPELGESAESLLHRRLVALVTRAASEQLALPREPTEDEWGGHVDDLEILLDPLVQAGWELPESYDSDFDSEHGAFLFGELHRTGMVIGIQYEPLAGKLQLLPCEGDGDPLLIGMLDQAAEIRAGSELSHSAGLVAEQAGKLGLLDATHLMAAPDSDITTAELISHRYGEEVFEPAARYRGLTLDELTGQLAADEEFSLRMRFITGWAGSRILPDLLPDAVALGIAAWCWRNDTEVETWHLPTDALMAKVNIAVTKAVRPHVDPVEGVDWEGVEDALTDSRWPLPDGRVISVLFGKGWPEVQRTVRKQVRMWRRFDEDLIGPEATLRLLTVTGSTSYTRHWWGQGRWAAICREIISDAIRAGVALPAPYDTQGPDTFLRDLIEPDALSDDVLAWMIDIPGAGDSGPWGLRGHESTRPITREFVLYDFGDAE